MLGEREVLGGETHRFRVEGVSPPNYRRFYMTWSITMADMRQEGYEEGISIGLERGLEQGAYQNKLEIAKSMYLDKVPVETISKYTNLPLDVVQNLIQAQ